MSAGAFVVATRYWGKDDDDLESLASFVRRASQHPCPTIVAINVKHDKSNALEALEEKLHPQSLKSLNVCLLAVPEWGGITPALNMIVKYVCQAFPGVRAVVFQSVEVHATVEQVNVLLSFVHSGGAVVAGGALPGHSKVSSDGLACRTPWNTLAAWNLCLLADGGFPSLADSVSPPGMEEVPAIARIFQKYGTSYGRVVLVQFPGEIQWKIKQGARMEKHIIKMESKERRAKQLLEWVRVESKGARDTRQVAYETEWVTWNEPEAAAQGGPGTAKTLRPTPMTNIAT